VAQQKAAEARKREAEEEAEAAKQRRAVEQAGAEAQAEAKPAAEAAAAVLELRSHPSKLIEAYSAVGLLRPCAENEAAVQELLPPPILDALGALARPIECAAVDGFSAALEGAHKAKVALETAQVHVGEMAVQGEEMGDAVAARDAQKIELERALARVDESYNGRTFRAEQARAIEDQARMGQGAKAILALPPFQGEVGLQGLAAPGDGPAVCDQATAAFKEWCDAHDPRERMAATDAVVEEAWAALARVAASKGGAEEHTAWQAASEAARTAIDTEKAHWTERPSPLISLPAELLIRAFRARAAERAAALTAIDGARAAVEEARAERQQLRCLPATPEQYIEALKRNHADHKQKRKAMHKAEYHVKMLDEDDDEAEHTAAQLALTKVLRSSTTLISHITP